MLAMGTVWGRGCRVRCYQIWQRRKAYIYDFHPIQLNKYLWSLYTQSLEYGNKNALLVHDELMFQCGKQTHK